MPKTPHNDKLQAAINNKKCSQDVPILKEAFAAYENWIEKMNSIKTSGKDKVIEMTSYLNEYKNYLEVE